MEERNELRWKTEAANLIKAINLIGNPVEIKTN